MKSERKECAPCVILILLKVWSTFYSTVTMHDTQRLQFVNNVCNSIDNFENLTQQECLAQLFKVKPRALGKYVKEIFLYRRDKLYKWNPYL